MQSDRSSTTATTSRGSRAPRQRQRALARRHLPPLGLVPEHDRVGDDVAPTAGEIVADLMALIDAGLVTVAVGDDDTPRYMAAHPDAVVMENDLDVDGARVRQIAVPPSDPENDDDDWGSAA